MDSIEKLRQKLLSLGGSVAHVIPYGIDNICEKLLNNGIYFSNSTIVTMDDQKVGLCHNNSINVWADNMDELKICTGYAIDDNVWYRHTWCIDKQGVIYECTPYKRGAYYGVPLSLQESKEFINETLYPNEIEEIKGKITK